MQKTYKSAMVLLMVMFAIKAQSQNLQFGKSRLVSSRTDTVPTGRVWKIESFVYSRPVVDCPTGTNPVNISDSIVINGNRVMVRAQRFSGQNASYQWSHGFGVSWSPEYIIWEQKTPMWLPAATTIAAGSGVLYISVLEFKEAP
jgi:hypothetical protein